MNNNTATTLNLDLLSIENALKNATAIKREEVDLLNQAWLLKCEAAKKQALLEQEQEIICRQVIAMFPKDKPFMYNSETTYSPVLTGPIQIVEASVHAIVDTEVYAVHMYAVEWGLPINKKTLRNKAIVQPKELVEWDESKAPKLLRKEKKKR